MKQYFLVLLIGHILGDYYLQTPALARRKDHDRSGLMIHLLSYGIPFLGLALLHRLDRALVLAGLLIWLAHGIIDLAKAPLMNRRQGDGHLQGMIYVLDQALHWLSLLVIASWFGNGAIVPWGWLDAVTTEFGLTWMRLLQWTLALLLVGHPSNVTFVKLFSAYKPPDAEASPILSSAPEPVERLRTGGLIGVLEKILALMLLSMGEAMAIGLILTAKSIARYDKISKSPSFAEYYLIGTLTSIIMVLIIWVLCFVALA